MGDAVQTCISLLSDALIHIYFSVACAGLHTACLCVCVCQEMGDGCANTCISLLSDALIHIYFSVACAAWFVYYQEMILG